MDQIEMSLWGSWNCILGRKQINKVMQLLQEKLHIKLKRINKYEAEMIYHWICMPL